MSSSHPQSSAVVGSDLQSSAATTEISEWKLIDPEQLQRDQAQDPVLVRVQAWLGSGQQPPWTAISALGPETKALHSQWPSGQNGLLYRFWGPGKFAITKTFRRLQSQFYWLGCW